MMLPPWWATPLTGLLASAEVRDVGLVGEHAAVHADVLAGDERGFVAGQEDHQRGDVLGGPEAGREAVAQHGLRHRLAARFLRDDDEARRYRVAPDALLAELGRD